MRTIQILLKNIIIKNKIVKAKMLLQRIKQGFNQVLGKSFKRTFSRLKNAPKRATSEKRFLALPQKFNAIIYKTFLEQNTQKLKQI